MHKLFLFLLFCITLGAQNRLEIISGNLDVNGTIFNADGDVVVIYDDMFLSANSIYFDRENKVLELNGNIFVLYANKHYIMGEHFVVDLEHNKQNYKPFYLHDKDEHTWINSQEARADNNEIIIESATVSTCDPTNPDWRIYFLAGTFYKEEKWLLLWSPTFFVNFFNLFEVPVFWLPLIGFPTDTSRHSGVLAPAFGVTDIDGFMLDIPYYFVLSDNTDLELRYQVREKRGHGLFSEFRFVDSISSKGSVRLGYFADYDSYVNQYSLRNNYHIGLELDYTKTGLGWLDWINDQGSDALFVDINLFNDIDYVALQAKSLTPISTSPIATSRINYTWSNQGYYAGLYGKYFIDTALTNNSQTLQELPKGQVHKFVDKLFIKELVYSADMKSVVRSRPTLANATETLLTAPVVFTLPLLYEYMTLTATENISFSNIIFTNLDDYTQFLDGASLSAATTIALGTDLTKSYGENIHTIQAGVSWSPAAAVLDARSGFYANSLGEFDDEDCNVGEACEFAQGSIQPPVDTVQFALTQYLFNQNGAQWFFHRMSQAIENDETISVGSLENEIRLTLGSLSLHNHMFAAFDTKKIEKMTSTISYNDKKTRNSITHFYQDQPEINKESNYITLNSRIMLGQYSVYGAYAYDAIYDQARNIKVGITLTKRCWGFDISYTDQTTPVLLDSGVSSYTDRSIYAKIQLIPLGGFDQRIPIDNN